MTQARKRIINPSIRGPENPLNLYRTYRVPSCCQEAMCYASLKGFVVRVVRC